MPRMGGYRYCARCGKAGEGLLASWSLSAGLVLRRAQAVRGWQAFSLLTAWTCVTGPLVGSAEFTGLGVLNVKCKKGSL